MKLESPKNFSFKTEAVPEMLVLKLGQFYELLKKGLEKWQNDFYISFFTSHNLFIFSGFIALNKMMQID